MSNTEFPGKTLQERREALGYSLQDVHGATHVPVSYLKLLEDGNIRSLPVETYTTGFIASYCQFMGLAPEPYLDRYNSCIYQRTNNTANQEIKAIFEGQKPVWLQDALTWGGICFALLLAWLAYATFTQPISDDQAPVEAGIMEIKPPTHFEEDF